MTVTRRQLVRLPRVAAIVCAVLLIAATAAAQPRFSIAVNGGYQPTTSEFDDGFMIELFEEGGNTDVHYPIEAGALFDVGGGVRLWRGLGAGVAISRFVRDGVASTTSLIPHPFFFRRFREVAGNAGGMEREETGVHLHARYDLPLTRRLHLTLMGGPSFLRIDQRIVTEVNYTEEYPYDTATFTGVDSRVVDGSATGFNAGVDVRWMFTESIGAGALVRFTRATVDLEPRQNRTIPVDAGGMHIGVGGRFLF